MNRDRRIHNRKYVQLLVQHQPIDAAVASIDYASDLSIGGLFIATKSPLPAMTRFQVQFSPSRDERMITADCEVTHVKSTGMGVRFQSIDAASVKLIDSLVRVH